MATVNVMGNYRGQSVPASTKKVIPQYGSGGTSIPYAPSAEDWAQAGQGVQKFIANKQGQARVTASQSPYQNQTTPTSSTNVMSNFRSYTTPVIPPQTQAGQQGIRYLQNTLTSKPLDISGSFTAGDNALKRQANDMRAQTQQQLGKADQLGQGQANIEAQKTESNIMSNLTTRESEKSLANINNLQNNQARQDAAANALANYGINRDQLNVQIQGQLASQKFQQLGIDQSQWKDMWELAQGSPILMGKLVTQKLDASGIQYNPEEVQQDIQLKAEADKQDPYIGALTKLVDGVILGNETEQTAPASVNDMNINDWQSKTQEDIQALSKDPNVKTIDNFDAFALRKSDFDKNYGFKKGDIIFYEGKPYKFNEFKTEKDSYVGSSYVGNKRYSSLVFTDLTTGKNIELKTEQGKIS